MNLFSKTLAAGAAALTLAIAFAPAAEARHGRGPGWGGGGHGGYWGGGWRHPRPWAPAYLGVGYYGGGCFITRKRVYDPYSGRMIIVRRNVCS